MNDKVLNDNTNAHDFTDQVSLDNSSETIQLSISSGCLWCGVFYENHPKSLYDDKITLTM